MPDSSNAIRLGVVGCGRATAVHHLPALRRLSDFTVTAVADTDPLRLGEVADRFSIPLRFPSHEDLLANADVDAVLVATPTMSHATIGLDALRAGKHLLMEKPLAISLEECDGLIQEAGRSPAIAMVALNSRWHRHTARAREMVRGGLLGHLWAIRSRYTHAHHGPGAQWWHSSRSLGGGVLFNDGVHHFDLWRHLLDTEVGRVHAESVDSDLFEDDTCTVSARLANGVLASAVLSFSTSPSSEVEILGEAGSLWLSFYRFDGLVFTPASTLPGSVTTRLREATNFLGSLPAGVAALRHGGDFDATYPTMWRHFADCIMRGATPTCTLGDGRAAVEVALACLESASDGRAVSLS